MSNFYESQSPPRGNQTPTQPKTVGTIPAKAPIPVAKAPTPAQIPPITTIPQTIPANIICCLGFNLCSPTSRLEGFTKRMKGRLILLIGSLPQSYAAPTFSVGSSIGSNPSAVEFTMGELFENSKMKRANNNSGNNKNNAINISGNNKNKIKAPKTTNNQNNNSKNTDNQIGTEDTVIDTEAQKAAEEATESTPLIPYLIIVGAVVALVAVGGVMYFKRQGDGDDGPSLIRIR